jgi:hypothetical protein
VSEEVFLPLFLAFIVYFAGYYGYTSHRWNYRVYTFGFAPVAGLLLSFAVMKIAYPEFSLPRQLAVGGVAVVGTVLLLLALFFVANRPK